IYVAFKALLHTFAEIVGKIILLIFFAISAVIKFIRIVLNDFIIPFLLKTIVRFFTASIDYLQNIYPKIIGYTLDNRLNAITLIVIPTVFCVFFILPRLGSELIPEVHQGEFNLEVAYQIGTPVEQTAANIEEIEELVKNIPGVRSVSSRSGVDKTATTKSEEGEHTAKITITLDPVPDMKDKELEVIENVRNIVKNISGVVTKITRNEMFSFKTPIEVFIKGFELNKLKEYAERAMSEISKVKGIVDLKTNLKQGNPEIHITYDREKIAKYGLNLFQIANLVKNKVLGDVSTKYRDRDRRIDITVLLKEDDKKSIDHLKRLIVNPDQQIPITLASISNIEVAEGPSEIRREDQERTAIITANINGERDLKSIIEEIDQKMADMHFSSDFFYELAGQNKEMETSINSLVGALLLAVFLVYIIMASQFESFVHPFVILFSIPLALIGVFFALYVTNISLSIMTYLGMIMLAGIVVNNAIVLISHINLLRQDGMEKREAIIEGGRVRLRPILMTTATTVLGLLPMALGLGDGAEMRQPMAITVISGLVSSTVLTLIIIPTLYAIFDRTEMKKQDATETEQLGDEFVSPFKA
ncbi:MAG: efflux RND transporter permease subunit, partial [Calditrichaeota bacterium]|nr:efflux RND transporter permease subunit [Calditrichota bacterium]